MRPKEKQFGQKVRQKVANAADPRITQIAATAGNAAGVVEVPNEPGFIYALSRKGIPYKVLNEVGDIPPRHPIIIGAIASDPNTLRVIKVQDVFWKKMEPRVRPHAKDHGYGGTDPLPVKLEMWMWFKTEPAPALGPFYVAIYRYSFVNDSDVILPPATEYLDLATHVPASGALFVLIEVLADGTINVVDGTPVTQRQDLTESDIPLPTSGARRLYAVSLYAGQTRVAIKGDWNDFYDLRLSDLGSGGGGGATPGGADGDIQFNDAGALGGDSTFHRNVDGSLNIGVLPVAFAANPYGFRQAASGLSLVNLHATYSDSHRTRITLIRARGSDSSPTAVLTDDSLGIYGFRGYDDAGSAGETSAWWEAFANEDFSTTEHGTRLSAFVTPDGTDVEILAFTFENDGNANFEGHRATNADDPIDPQDLVTLNHFTDSNIATSDITTNNASTTKHGFLKKLSNVVSEWMNGAGNWTTPLANLILPCHGLNGTIAALTTNYLPFFYYGLNATPFNLAVPRAGTAQNMTVVLNSAQPGGGTGGSLVITVMKNNVDTGMVLTIAAGSAAGTYTYSATSVSFAGGDRIIFKIVNNATGAASAQVGACSLEFAVPVS